MGQLGRSVTRGRAWGRGDAGASHAVGVSAAVVLAGGVMLGITQLDVPRTVACAVGGGVGQALEGGGSHECGVAAGARDKVEMSRERGTGESGPEVALKLGAAGSELAQGSGPKGGAVSTVVSGYPPASQQAVQAVQSSIAAGVKSELGERGAGSWIDQKSGELRVGVTSTADAALVRARGAVPVMVERTMGELEAVRDEVVRRTEDLGDWGYLLSVDPENNRVLVQFATPLPDGGVAQFERTVGDAGPVTVVDYEDELENPPLTGSLTTPVEDREQASEGNDGSSAVVTGPAPLLGGDQMGACSLGFNTVGKGGAGTFLTAGHCFDGVGGPSDIALQDGEALGLPWKVINDETSDSASGLVNGVRFEGVSAVQAPASVGGPIAVVGQEEAPVGATVCKSGKSTGLTCGKIQAHEVYRSSDLWKDEKPSGLTLWDGCAEHGDSGGSVISPAGQAQGIISSGPSVATDGGQRLCPSKVGKKNKTLYAPVADALGAHDTTLALAPR